MKFTHIDIITGRLIKINKTWDGTDATWADCEVFYKLDNTIDNQVINMTFIEKLQKPIYKEINYDYMSYAV